MPTRKSQIIGSLLALVIFLIALNFIRDQIKDYGLENIISDIAEIPKEAFCISFAFMLLSYLVLTFYDWLAIKYVKSKLPYVKVGFASVIAYTMSHNLGFSVITGGATRYRLLSAWGMPAGDIARAVLFSGGIFWLGATALSGLVLTYHPPEMPPGVVSTFINLRLLGIICLAIVFSYFFLFNVKGKTLRLFRFEFPPPPLKLSLCAMLVATCDWILAALVAYSILPTHSMSFIQFLGLFQLGQTLSIVSYVPGGLGVLESVMLYFLTQQDIPSHTVLSAVLGYRLVYYFIPLLGGMFLFIAHEGYLWTKTFRRKNRDGTKI